MLYYLLGIWGLYKCYILWNLMLSIYKHEYATTPPLTMLRTAGFDVQRTFGATFDNPGHLAKSITTWRLFQFLIKKCCFESLFQTHKS